MQNTETTKANMTSYLRDIVASVARDICPVSRQQLAYECAFPEASETVNAMLQDGALAVVGDWGGDVPYPVVGLTG